MSLPSAPWGPSSCLSAPLRPLSCASFIPAEARLLTAELPATAPAVVASLCLSMSYPSGLQSPKSQESVP